MRIRYRWWGIVAVGSLVSCGGDGDRYVGMETYARAVSSYYVAAAPPVIATRYVPIVPRSAPYRYVYGYDRYDFWPPRSALRAYLDCRAWGHVRVSRSPYRCSFPYRYRHYEIVSRHLDCAMEECFDRGPLRVGCRCLRLALNSLPQDDPMYSRLERIRDAEKNGDVGELKEMTMDAIGDLAHWMSSAETDPTREP